ncbi:MAG: BrnT family toxin [Chloroflexota bacterium]|nr:MAG: BrnT family toxin [Chloroflexota bacterium]
MRIYELVIEPDREDHIARHGVVVAEVEDITSGNPFISRTRQRYHRLIGQTAAGRYLTVIVGFRGDGVYGLVTAREADQAERRLYQRHRRD